MYVIQQNTIWHRMHKQATALMKFIAAQAHYETHWARYLFYWTAVVASITALTRG